MPESKEIEINAEPSKCYEAICNFESYPQWQKSIREVTVLEREQGRPTIVEYKLDAVIKVVSYTLSYTYEDKNPENLLLAWGYVGGDLKKIEGRYSFQKVAPGKTLAKFWLDVEIGAWVPAFILDKFKTITMRESVEALKKRVESC